VRLFILTILASGMAVPLFAGPPVGHPPSVRFNPPTRGFCPPSVPHAPSFKPSGVTHIGSPVRAVPHHTPSFLGGTPVSRGGTYVPYRVGAPMWSHYTGNYGSSWGGWVPGGGTYFPWYRGAPFWSYYTGDYGNYWGGWTPPLLRPPHSVPSRPWYYWGSGASPHEDDRPVNVTINQPTYIIQQPAAPENATGTFQYYRKFEE